MKGNWGWGTKWLSWAGDGSKQLWGMEWACAISVCLGQCCLLLPKCIWVPLADLEQCDCRVFRGFLLRNTPRFSHWMLCLIRRPLPSPPHLRLLRKLAATVILPSRLHCALKMPPPVVPTCFSDIDTYPALQGQPRFPDPKHLLPSLSYIITSNAQILIKLRRTERLLLVMSTKFKWFSLSGKSYMTDLWNKLCWLLSTGILWLTAVVFKEWLALAGGKQRQINIMWFVESLSGGLSNRAV